MKDELRDRLTIINAFVHDVATGTWLSALVLMTSLHLRTRGPEWAPVATLLSSLKGDVMWLSWGSLATISLTGVVRALTFRAFGWTGDVAKSRVRLLKIKHALLGTTFLGGTVYQVWVAYSL